MSYRVSRREALLALGAAVTARAEIAPEVVQRNDAETAKLLSRQITSPEDRNRGGYADDVGLYPANSGSHILEVLSAAFVSEASKYHRDPSLLERMRLAAAYLERQQSPDGNISLLSTNFNSPPDTGFVTHNVATCASLGKRYGHDELVQIPKNFLLKAAAGMAKGGVHTPNHRWVVSSALAQVHEVFPDPRWLRRIGQWLAEGTDIDSDGQYTERSVLTYNVVADRAFTVIAAKLNRPELLDPVRRNLQSMLYLLHADGEVVSAISRRQDVNTRGDMGRYWFPLQYMALADRNGQFAALARHYSGQYASLSALLEYPELDRPLPPDQALPEDFERLMPAIGIARIRRGQTSATVILGGSSRFFALRQGDAVVQAVRFASSFFGKGQFVPSGGSKVGDAYVLKQQLEAPYYQPLAQPVPPEAWGTLHSLRQRSEICRLEQSASITENKSGFSLRIRSNGTEGVPVAVEVNLREGGKLDGGVASPRLPDAFLLGAGEAVYRRGKDTLRIGPGKADHGYIDIRGAEPKLPGPSLYLTGLTPFDHTLEFRWS